MNKLGRLTVFAVIIISFASFKLPSEDAFVLPPDVAPLSPLERPRPSPYNLPLQYADWVIRYTDETGIPVWMACRLFAQESTGCPLSGTWDPEAVSWMGAEGLAQLMPENLSLFAAKYNDGHPIDPFDPETAICVGLRYLADLVRASGSWRIGVMAYNGGLGHWTNPARYGDWLPESVAYVRAILGGTP